MRRLIGGWFAYNMKNQLEMAKYFIINIKIGKRLVKPHRRKSEEKVNIHLRNNTVPQRGYKHVKVNSALGHLILI